MRLIALLGACILFFLAFLQGEADSKGWFTIVEVQVKGDLQYASVDELNRTYTELIGQSLLLTSVSDMQKVTNKPEWIAATKVRKLWPNKLLVTVKEHMPLAYWRNDGVITAEGSVIHPKNLLSLDIPHIIGPEGSDVVVLEQFRLISQVLSNADLKIKTLQLEERGSWNVRFTNNLLVKLGRDEILERLQRFIAVYKSDLSGRIDDVDLVDARYSHGVAVTWKKQES